jgi:hypothetical protein
MAFKCGMRMSFRQVKNPHMKNSVVTTAMAEVFVDAGWLVLVVAFPTLAIAMKPDLLALWRFYVRRPAFRTLPEALTTTRRSYRIHPEIVNGDLLVSCTLPIRQGGGCETLPLPDRL